MKLSTKMLVYASCDTKQSYKDWISNEDRRRHDRRILRCGLRTWEFSSFRYFYLSGNNQALINATGHDHDSFRKLLRLFSVTYVYWTWDRHTHLIRRKKVDRNGDPCGRPRDLTPIGCLGLIHIVSILWFIVK